MIERYEGRMQVLCNICPASYPNTYAAEDFKVMIADVKTAGWRLTKAAVDPQRGRGTADLFGKQPIVACQAKPQEWLHACPGCQMPDAEEKLL
jgi:hypothetical protein